MSVVELSAVCERRRESGRPYLEFLRVPAMSAGVYVLPARGLDPQRPHREDEIYFVTSGRSLVRIGDADEPVGPGSFVYVPAGVEHRFHSIEEELTLLVVFAPAESS
jgi:mannose-6-phosphate isomerase-like protein (cupin superfamily)